MSDEQKKAAAKQLSEYPSAFGFQPVSLYLF